MRIEVGLQMAEYRADHFEPLAGETFEFATPGGERLELRLLEVKRGQRLHAKLREPFSLLFALESAWGPHSGTLFLKRDGFEEAGWFVSRVSVLGGDPGVAYCEAVFG
ncbi:MAG TPA: hypothetical protein DEH78_22010 [Solibacterales bacterium]|nr:hypothetical protein [Bryobacterales bacterium]